MRLEEIHNIDVRRIASSLDLESATVEGRRRIKSVKLVRAAKLGGVELPEQTELRFKEASGEDVLIEALLGREATVGGVACICGAEIGFAPDRPLRVRALRHAFREVIDVQGFPVYPMSEVTFHAAGTLEELRLGRDREWHGLVLRRESFLRFARSGETSVSLSEPLLVTGITFPEKAALTFDAHGTLLEAFTPAALRVAEDEFKERTTIPFTVEGRVDRVAAVARGALEERSLTDEERSRLAARRKGPCA